MSVLRIEDRLVLVADVKPTDSEKRSSLMASAQSNVVELHSTGVRVCLKLTHVLRSSRDQFLEWVSHRPLEIDIMADLNMATDSFEAAQECLLLGQYRLKMITVLCAAGIGQLKTVQALLPDTELVAVPAPAGFTDSDSRAIYGQPLDMAVQRLTTVTKMSGAKGIMVPKLSHIKNTRRAVGPHTNIMTQEMVRPTSTQLAMSDHARGKMPTVEEAIKAGADKVLVPAHFVLGEKEKYRRDVIENIFQEIESALGVNA